MSLLMSLLLLFSPQILDLPPEAPVDSPAIALLPAVRGTQVQVTETSPPPTDEVPSFTSDCSEMSWYRSQAGLPSRFDGIGWRESNCRNEDGVHTSCCYGWWQLNVGLHLRDARIAPRYRACGVDSYQDVNSDTPGDKQRQACAAKALFDVVGYSAWSATS
jgi:hypothetical protein